MNDRLLINDINDRLAHEYDFKKRGIHVRGKCPSCGEKEAWTTEDSPWVIFCGRSNKCGETHTARSLFSDLFENFSERFPSTVEDPSATARAYLTQDRQFDLSVIKDRWQQGALQLIDGSYTPTVRFPLWDNHYWERVIDRKAIPLMPRHIKGKSHFSGGIRSSRREDS